MISFIVPAHNEEAWIGRSVSAITDSMRGIGEEWEVIVVLDAPVVTSGRSIRAQSFWTIARIFARRAF